MKPQDEMFALDSDSEYDHEEVRPLVGAYSTPLRRCKPPRWTFAIALGVFLLLSFAISLYVKSI
jgi:3-phytase